MGFAAQVITGEINFSLSEMTSAFLFGIVWRSLSFWIPIFGKLIALGHLWFLWNLFLYSLIWTPVFNSVRNNPGGIPARTIKSIFTMRYNIGPILLMPLILASSEIIFKPFFPYFIGVAYEWFWFFIFFAIDFHVLLPRGNGTILSRLGPS